MLKSLLGAIQYFKTQNRNLGREINIPEEDERREIKRIDRQLKRKKRESHIGRRYFRNFGDEILQRPAQQQEPANRRNETTWDKQ